MAQYDHQNLAMTVHKIYRRRLPCEVGHAIDPYQNGGNKWTWSHRWVAGPAGRRRTDGRHSTPLGRCQDCGKTPREILDPPVLPRVKREVDVTSDGFLRAAIESGR